MSEELDQAVPKLLHLRPCLLFVPLTLKIPVLKHKLERVLQDREAQGATNKALKQLEDMQRQLSESRLS